MSPETARPRQGSRQVARCRGAEMGCTNPRLLFVGRVDDPDRPCAVGADVVLPGNTAHERQSILGASR